MFRARKSRTQLFLGTMTLFGSAFSGMIAAQAAVCLVENDGSTTTLAAVGPSLGETACGFAAFATGNQSSAYGSNSEASGEASVAVGVGTLASGDNSVAVGLNASASGTGAAAIGWGSIASGQRGVAVGEGADAGGLNAVAVGAYANASGEGSYAAGYLSSAEGTASIALGNGSTARGSGSIVIGRASQTLGDNSIAIGNGVTATRESQVAIGNSSNTYTFAGITSAASLAAQSGAIQVVTTDASGNLATDGGALSAAIDTLGGRVGENTTGLVAVNARVTESNATIADISTRLDAMGGGFSGFAGDIQQNREGIAMAMAMDVPYVPPGKDFAMGAAVGHFGGSTAFGLSGAFRMGSDVQVDLGLGATRSYQGGRVGVTWAW